jgi:NAD(P)H dehydrogenase (quinone)
MRVMVVYAHPVETSFNAAIYGVVTETLRKRGHEVDACDLYAENFPAIMSREDRLLYHTIPANRALAAPWIERGWRGWTPWCWSFRPGSSRPPPS